MKKHLLIISLAIVLAITFLASPILAWTAKPYLNHGEWETQGFTLPGDLDVDSSGAVDRHDLISFENSYPSIRGDANYDITWDIDLNGTVDATDFNIFNDYYEQVAPTVSVEYITTVDECQIWKTSEADLDNWIKQWNITGKRSYQRADSDIEGLEFVCVQYSIERVVTFEDNYGVHACCYILEVGGEHAMAGALVGDDPLDPYNWMTWSMKGLHHNRISDKTYPPAYPIMVFIGQVDATPYICFNMRGERGYYVHSTMYLTYADWLYDNFIALR